jgi:hypothetical protein
MTRAVRALLLGLVAAATALLPDVATAQDADGPSITADRVDVSPGESVVVTLSGWQANVVTVSVCGNAAARGSGDCNMVASEGIGLHGGGPTTQRDFVVTAPPTNCPCVLRASSPSNDEVAVAQIELIGHPVGPIVGSPARRPLEVTVDARRATSGILGALRSSLGGPTPYDVTITLHNASAEPVTSVSLAGSATRGADDVVTIEIPPPAALPPGETWTQTVRAEVPAPAVGTVEWQVAASGAGPMVAAEQRMRNVPVGLLVLVLVFVVDMVAIAVRRLSRHRQRADGRPSQAQAASAVASVG